jgi:tetratricopeptide (TPR) repeat protein
MWRTGANSATKITFSDDVKLEGSEVKAGTYAIYTIPNKDSWEIMLYKDLTLGGNVADYKVENEVLRMKVLPTAYLEKVETFTINLNDITPTSTTLELIWDKTKVPVKITTEIDAKVMKSIETTVVNDSRPYYQAASYYLDNNKDLNQALVWVNKALEQNPKAFYMMMTKAKIELKLQNKTAAIASAEKTILLAKDAKNEDFVKMAETFIAENKK